MPILTSLMTGRIKMSLICAFCKGNLKQSKTISTVDVNGCIVVIENVPCLKCQQCGEKYFSDEVKLRMENIINQAANDLSKVTVIDYSKQTSNVEN